MGISSVSAPVEQRLANYRACSSQALHQAAKSHDPETRAAFLAAAARWKALAEEIEKIKGLISCDWCSP